MSSYEMKNKSIRLSEEVTENYVLITLFAIPNL